MVALGVGAGYRVQAAHLDDEADSTRAAVRQQAEDNGLEPDTACSQPANVRPAPCSTLTDQLDNRNHASAISNGAFIAAGVVGIGTVVAYLLWPSDHHGGDHGPAAPAAVGLWWSDSVRGLSFSSKF